jgi:uncharacterized protein YecE (DUF72 family)
LNWLIGCSGFSYKEWKGEFYPPDIPQRKWFEHYCRHFNTLELNTTFYRYPTVKSLQSWYHQSPPGFVFSAKVPRGVTHFRKMVDTERMLGDFYQLLREGLAEKLGSVLFQLPPQFDHSEERLAAILRQADPSFRNSVEFRHASWWRPDVMEALGKQDISFCGVSFPKIAFDDAVINTDHCYYRFHGVPRLFYSEYEPAFVEKIFQQISSHKELQTAYVYFNNTASTAALHNAAYLQELVKRES